MRKFHFNFPTDYYNMPRLQIPCMLGEPVQCYCGRMFKDTQARGRHFRACPAWKQFSVEQKKEHRERVSFLNVLHGHNPERGRYKFCMEELLKLRIAS